MGQWQPSKSAAWDRRWNFETRRTATNNWQSPWHGVERFRWRCLCTVFFSSAMDGFHHARYGHDASGSFWWSLVASTALINNEIVQWSNMKQIQQKFSSVLALLLNLVRAMSLRFDSMVGEMISSKTTPFQLCENKKARNACGHIRKELTIFLGVR